MLAALIFDANRGEAIVETECDVSNKQKLTFSKIPVPVPVPKR